MRCGTLQFGCSLVRCSSVDRVEHVHARDHNNYYGFDIDFEMRALTGKFWQIQVFCLNCVEGILQCRRPFLNTRKT